MIRIGREIQCLPYAGFLSCTPYVKAGEAGGVHQFKSLTNLFVLNNFF